MFEFSKIVGLLLHPSLLILLSCVVGLLCALVRRTARLGRALLMVSAALLVFAALPMSDWPIEILEDRFPEPTRLPDHVDGIIVLGGAINLGVSAEHDAPTLKAGADRITTFLALARYFPGAKLVYTGGYGEADVARDLFGGLGLDLDRVTFERKSRTTWENALFSKRLVQPAEGETWLLVTSAIDIPRAVACFRAVGWHITPWPAGYLIQHDRDAYLPNLPQGLANLDWATHEWLGLVYYRLRGWTDTWFPAPERGGQSV